MTDAANELVLTRLIDAPREKLFRCWTDPSLLKRWFAPEPFTTPIAEVDLRVGGANRIVMKAPDGQEIPCPGTFLEIVPHEKLVFTLNRLNCMNLEQHLARSEFLDKKSRK